MTIVVEVLATNCGDRARAATIKNSTDLHLRGDNSFTSRKRPDSVGEVYGGQIEGFSYSGGKIDGKEKSAC